MKTFQIEHVEETKLDPDKYNNKWYSVKFKGIAENVLWKAKARPEADTKVFGQISPSSTGKSEIFRKMQKPDDYVEPAQTNIAEGTQDILEGITAGSDKVPQAIKSSSTEHKLDQILELSRENNVILKTLAGEPRITREDEDTINLEGLE